MMSYGHRSRANAGSDINYIALFIVNGGTPVSSVRFSSFQITSNDTAYVSGHSCSNMMFFKLNQGASTIRLLLNDKRFPIFKYSWIIGPIFSGLFIRPALVAPGARK